MRKRHVGYGRAWLTRAVATGTALVLGAMLPGAAFAWSVPAVGTEAAPAAAPAGPWLSQTPPSQPMQAVGDRLGSQIQGFYEIQYDSQAAAGSEMLHWTQMAAMMAAPVALLAAKKSGGGGGGGKGALKHFIPKPPLGATPPAPVPEPRSIALFGLSAALLAAVALRRRHVGVKAENRVS